VDIPALADALKSGQIGGAAVDVFPKEPKGNDDEFVSELRGLDNVILTPHIGGSTQEAQANIGKEVGEKLSTYSDTGATLSAVNFPQVSLPQHGDFHRILHIHQNVPGVLNKINTIFAENNINILGQFLQTTADIGYVVVDVEASAGELALEKVLEVEGTIRARILF
jgi:D-3-phosphoglycerate dehydrogenase